MKNKQQDLVNHLFAQLERLGDENLTAAELKLECDRSKAIASTASQLNQTVKLSIDVQTLRADMPPNKELPKMLQ